MILLNRHSIYLSVSKVLIDMEVSLPLLTCFPLIRYASATAADVRLWPPSLSVSQLNFAC
jgi:hypothetical protein